MVPVFVTRLVAALPPSTSTPKVAPLIVPPLWLVTVPPPVKARPPTLVPTIAPEFVAAPAPPDATTPKAPPLIFPVLVTVPPPLKTAPFPVAAAP